MVITTIRAEVDEAVHDETEVVLRGIGITLPEAVAMMMHHIATEKSLPFPLDCPHCPIIPGETTLAAMAEAEQGDLRSFESVAELMDWLDADD